MPKQPLKKGGTMNKRDIISSLFWMAFGLIFLIGGIQHGLMEAHDVPGRGALPFLAGIVCIGLSLLVLILAVIRLKKESEVKISFFPESDSWKRLLMAITFLAFYGLFLKMLGFPLTTLLFLIGVLRYIEPQPLRTTFTFSVITTVVTYTIFKLLKFNLPTGILGL